jgi:hypothetical protein
LENQVHSGLIRKESGRKMELDIFLPSENLAFEYQGEHHYYDIYAVGRNRWLQSQKDEEKREACQREGITLIEIPFWWDGDRSSLMATIYKHRKDLCKAEITGIPIPEYPLKAFPIGLQSLCVSHWIAPVPELMHAENWDGVQNLKGW